MAPNPLIGVPLHWLGGFASGSFYVPFRKVKKWSWETYWLVGGTFAWIICPWLFALLLTKNLLGVIAAQPLSTLGWTYFFGLLWGLGGLTYGLTMRYLGLSLGTGVALGFCAAFGTLVPPIFKLLVPAVPVSESIGQIASSRAGQITLAGIGICLLGIVIAALAGLMKERESSFEQKRMAIAEFSFFKGFLVATFSGIMSSCFAFALTAGNPISVTSLAAGTSPIWSGLPKLVVLVTGGFTTNFIWCLALNLRNRTGYQYFASRVRPEHAHLTAAGGDGAGAMQSNTASLQVDLKSPILRNYLFSALAGTTWYFQFFFYTMGETQMGRYSFASWTLHMASIIIFATMWGVIFQEWKGSSRKARGLIAAGIATLIISTIIVGWGTYLKARSTIELGDAGNIHFRKKLPPVERLALLAERHVNDRTEVRPEGPRPDRIAVTGSREYIHFAYAPGPLNLTGNSAFALSSADGLFKAANAAIVGNDSVAVEGPIVPGPLPVRCAWDPFPKGFWRDPNGLPAPPFSCAIPAATPAG